MRRPTKPPRKRRRREREIIELIDVAANAFTAGISRNRSGKASSAHDIVATDGLKAKGGLRGSESGILATKKNFVDIARAGDPGLIRASSKAAFLRIARNDSHLAILEMRRASFRAPPERRRRNVV